MKKTVITTITMLAVCLLAAPGFADVKKGEKIDGAKEFAKHCAVCHPNGGNIINKKKTLKKAALAASGIKDWKGIVKNMRNPGPGMTKFDAKTIPDNEAKAIAEYILKTFK
ncbi:cytochrome C [bacterium]|nr:cytochrome C [bacterium]